MIVRQIKDLKQHNKVLEELREVDEDMDSSDYQQSAGRTLNPEQPQSETIERQNSDYECAPTQPLQKTNAFLKPESILNAEKALKFDILQIIPPVEPSISETVRKQLLQHRNRIQNDKLSKKLDEPRYAFNRSVRYTSDQTNTNYMKPTIQINQNEEEGKPVEKIRKRNPFELPQSKILKQLHESLHQKTNKDDDQVNETLKSKFNTSMAKSRLQDTLSKFGSIRPKEQYQEKRPRYSYEKQEKIQNQSTKSRFTQQNSTKMIWDQIRSNTLSLHSEKQVKRSVPREVESDDSQFSTIFGRFEHPKASDFEEDIVPISYFQPKQTSTDRIVISYKTTLLQLKQFCRIQDIQQQQVVIMIPEPLSAQKFYADQRQSQIFQEARSLLKKLAINMSSISIKRYTNCVIIVSDRIAIVSHFSGQIYLGGWSGSQKIGLGLQWCPGKFIYYGEYRNNKRNGVGIYKGTDGNVAAGLWRNSAYLGHLLEVSRPSKDTDPLHQYE